MDNQLQEVSNWFSLEWFYPSTFAAFTWQYALLLWLLLAIPVIYLIRMLFAWRSGQKLIIALPEERMKMDITSLLRFIPPMMMWIFIALIIVALGRPQRSNEQVEQWTEGIDIILAIDISESMQLQDFKPNRLEAAKRVATEFIEGRFQDRIGLVIFSGDAYSLSPLTTDYDLLKSFIKDIDFSQIESRGTAIGSALTVATNRMVESDSKSKIVILLSDGDNTAGNIDPITAAKLASAYDIKLYSVAIGKEGRVPRGVGMFGQVQYVQNTLDETTLREIAQIGNGQFFRASDNEALKNIFSMIDEYEKAEIKETRFKNTTDYYPVYLKWAIIIFLLWILLKSTFISNVLID